MNTFIRYMILSIVCCLVVACNSTEGTCVPLGEGGAPGGVGGGGPIVPGQGGFGEAPPEPQEKDEEGEIPCNAEEGKSSPGAGKEFTCTGDIVCYKPNAGGGQSTAGCHFPVKRFTAASAEKLVAGLLAKCSGEHPGYTCSAEELTCTDTPAQLYGCNGGITCVDDKGYKSGCIVGEPSDDPYSALPSDVYAYDEPDAVDHLADLCEVLKHDKYGNNCQHGGMCCIPSSVSCIKKVK